jgi:hypothetical protein
VVNVNKTLTDARKATSTIITRLRKPRPIHDQPPLLLLRSLHRRRPSLLFLRRLLLFLPLILPLSTHQTLSTTRIPPTNTLNKRLHTIRTHQMLNTTHTQHTDSLHLTPLLPLTSHDADHSPTIAPSVKKPSQIASHGSSYTQSSADASSITPTPTRVFGSSLRML